MKRKAEIVNIITNLATWIQFQTATLIKSRNIYITLITTDTV
jgi:hypothetical protein